MADQNFLRCQCNAKASYLCANDGANLCSHHFLSLHSNHEVYYYVKNLKKDFRTSIIQGLTLIKSNIESSLCELNARTQRIYNEINEMYNKTQSEIAGALEIVNTMIDDFNKAEEEMIVAYPIISQIELNTARTMEGLKHCFNLQISDVSLLREIPDLFSVFSGVQRLFKASIREQPIIPDLCEKKKHLYNVFREANSRYSNISDPSDLLATWIHCMRHSRNTENLRLLSIDGENLSENQIECFGYLPLAYQIKEVMLSNFGKDNFDRVLDTTLSRCRHLENIEIDSCEIEGNICEKLSQVLSNSMYLKEIIISSCETGERIVKSIGNTDLSSLIMLGLPSNMIGDNGIRMLCQFFPRMSRLKYLNLRNNDLGEQAGLELRIYLRYLTKLVEIDLSSNAIGKVAGEIFESLSSLPYLGSIDYSSIQLEEFQEEIIIANVKKLKYLDTFVLDMVLSEKFLRPLKQAVPEFCHIYRNNPDQDVRIEYKL